MRRQPLIFLFLELSFCFFQFEAVFAQQELYLPGKSYFGRNKYIEYVAGNIPLIISISHGGNLKPEEIPDRRYGTKLSDLYTIQIGREIAKEFYRVTGGYPHLVICHLKRTKIDCNREIKEATQGNKWAEKAWQEFHSYIEQAKQLSLEHYPRCFYIDIHGHTHAIQRLELGYLLVRDDLKRNNKSLYLLRQKTSIRFLLEHTPGDFSEMIRGKTSFGGLMQERNFPAVPSPQYPHPEDQPYYPGGYNVMRHTFYATAPIPGFQLEINSHIRKDKATRKEFAQKFVEAIRIYLAMHYDLSIKNKEEKPKKNSTEK